MKHAEHNQQYICYAYLTPSANPLQVVVVPHLRIISFTKSGLKWYQSIAELPNGTKQFPCLAFPRRIMKQLSRSVFSR